MNGRKRIYTDENFITKKNVVGVVSEAFTLHQANAGEISLLMDIEKNVQSLSREKTIRPEINVIATDPIPAQIVDFKQGYENGTPINYIQRANVDSENPNDSDLETRKDDLRIATLNEMMRECKKASKDNKLSRDLKICGVGYRYITPNKTNRGISPFRIYILNPECTFIIYRNNVEEDAIAAVTYVTDKGAVVKYNVWTNESFFEFGPSIKGIIERPNVIGMIPIVEYINNYDLMGSFEKQLPLIDAYNIVTSDRVNDLCQQVQSILWMHNTKIDEEQKGELVNGGVIQTQATADGKEVKIQYINAPLRQSDIQTLASDIKERILESAGVPKLSNQDNSTGEATRITNGWHTAETQAKISELTWREAEDRTLEICLEFIRSQKENLNDIQSLKLSDIGYDMHRSENYDIASRVNSFATLVNIGSDIKKSAQLCKITDDPLQFALDSENGINKLRFASLSTNSTPDKENSPNEAKIDLESNDKALETEKSLQPSKVTNL